MKKKRQVEDFYNEMGPLTLMMYLVDVELDKLNRERDILIRWNVPCDEFMKVTLCIDALEKKRNEILKWMEKAIAVTPWNIDTTTGGKVDKKLRTESGKWVKVIIPKEKTQ